MSPKISSFTEAKRRDMATIVYSISPKTDKVLGKHEILVRFFHGRTNLHIKTGLFTDVDAWDQERQCNKIPKIRVMSEDKKNLVKELTEQNGILKALSQFIMSEFIECGGGKEAFGKDWLKETYKKFQSKDIAVKEDSEEDIPKESMLDVFNRYIESIHSMADSQKAQHKVIWRALKRFSLYTGISIEFEDFTADTLRELERFLLTEHQFIGKDSNNKPKIIDRKYKKAYDAVPECRFPKQRGKNTIIKLMTRLRTFMKWAKKEKYIRDYPFEDYDMGTSMYGTPYYLTKAERNQLFQATFPDNPGLDIQRDIFVFQCFIGCRIGDFMKMTKDNVINDAIEYVPRKTKEGRPITVRVPLSPTAKEILDRYPEVKGNRLLPFICEQDYNRSIKKMIRLAGIDRIITKLNTITREEEKRPIWEVASSHMARRVLVGNLYKELKDPNLIAKISGHAENSKAFNRYRDIDEEMAKEVILKLE